MALSLLTDLRYFHVLPALGVSIPTTALPIMLKCPLCQSNTLWVTNNVGLWGEWLYCQDCKKAGDLLEWATAVLKRPVEDCLAKLTNIGVFNKQADLTPQLADYRTGWPRVRNFGMFLLQNARTQLDQASTDTLRPLAKFMQTHWIDPDLRQRISRYFGLVNMEQLKNPGAKFKNLDTLVTLTYDLPGRIAGVSLLTLEDDCPPSLSHRSLAKLAGVQQYNKCAGVAFLPQALETKQRDIIVYCDLVEATKTCLRWFRGGNDMLPMVIPVQQSMRSTKTVWNYLPPRNLIFAGTLDNTLNFASRCNGNICELEHQPFSGTRAAPYYINQIKNKAKPWQQVVIDKLRNSLENQRTNLFLSLDIVPSARAAFINQAPVELKQQITAPLTENNWRTFPLYTNCSVLETASGWSLMNKKKVTNGIIRVDRIITLGDRHTAGARVCGRVLLHGVIYPFETSVATIDREGLFKFIAKFLLTKHGCPNFKYSHEWNSRGWELALTAYQPETVKAQPQIGWDVKNQNFVFNNFVIGAEGAVNNNWLRNYSNNGFIPTHDTQKPLDLLPGELTTVLEREDLFAQSIWLMVAAVLHNVLAPYVGRRMQPIFGGMRNKYNTSASPLLQVAAALGCGSAYYAYWGRRVLRTRVAAAKTHNWPITTQCCSLKFLNELLLADNCSNLIVGTTPGVAFSLAGIGVPEPTGLIVNDWLHTLKQLMPQVLRFVLKNKLAPISFDNSLKSTFDVLANWLQDNNVNTGGLQTARNTYDILQTPAFKMLTCLGEPAATKQAHLATGKTRAAKLNYLTEVFAPPHTDLTKNITVFRHNAQIYVSKIMFDVFHKNYIAHITKPAVVSGKDYFTYEESAWNKAARLYSQLFDN